MTQLNTPVHIGDGAYVQTDGWYYWLGANNPNSKLVALERRSILMLLMFAINIDPSIVSDIEDIIDRDKDDK